MNMKFILLINVKTPTIVGILTFISIINTTPERMRDENTLLIHHFNFYEQLKFYARLVEHNLGVWFLYLFPAFNFDSVKSDIL